MSAETDIAVDGRLPPTAGRFAFAMRALGSGEPPRRLRVGAIVYTRIKVIKHDFFAATAFYDSSAGPAVLKIARVEPAYGVPLDWIGRWLCRRELWYYRKFADLPNVPAVIARVGTTGFLHAFVPGRPLDRGMAVPDSFFPELLELLRTLRRRGVAYVDTNKPQNILLGDDGRPHLIDFQISFDAATLPVLGRRVLKMLAGADEYHVLKHIKRFRRDQLTAAERARLDRKAWYIRLHRAGTRPYFIIRRAVMGKLRRDGMILPEGSK